MPDRLSPLTDGQQVRVVSRVSPAADAGVSEDQGKIEILTTLAAGGGASRGGGTALRKECVGRHPSDSLPKGRAAPPPVRIRRLVQMPAPASFRKRGPRALKALRRLLSTMALRRLPAPMAAPSEDTRP